MSQLTIDPKVHKILEDFKLPDDLSFGKTLCPMMIECDYQNGSWGELKMVPYAKIELDPTCKTLHYAQEIFEGMKAYQVNGEGPFLFRPQENMKRFQLSAERMAMEPVPEEIFMTAVREMTAYSSKLIPGHSGDSLYIRPFQFATDNHLGIKPSDSFKFMVVASPSSAYFSGGSVKVLIERESVRACPGGVGAAKTGGNYAASLLSMVNAKKKGYDQVLWLDALNKEMIEEMSGMNFFAVYDGEIITPKLTQTILDGITRKSVIEMARSMNITVKEEVLNIAQLIEDIKSGKCTECFACGTAVIITPVSALGEKDGELYSLKHSEGPMAKKLRDELLGIQEGTRPDPFEWRERISPA